MAQVLTTFDPDEFRALVREAVDDALHERAEEPKLLDRTRLAQKLCCSPSHIDTLRSRGLPTEYVGDSPRFELSAVLTWIREQKVK